jgi:hypothetical protein
METPIMSLSNRRFTNTVNGWGVYGIGETKFGYTARQEISRHSNQVLWRECGLGDGVCKKHTRAEHTHILAAEIQLFPVSVD